MATPWHHQLSTNVALLLLFITAASLLEAATAMTSLEFSSTVSEATKPTVRAEMTLVEPAPVNGLGRFNTEQIAYHVRASIARAKLLGARMQKQRKSTADAWQSDVRAIPGGYAMSLSLGTPPQTFTVLADTGSDLTWVQAKISTLLVGNCEYTYEYGGGSTTSGAFSTETISITTMDAVVQTVPNFAFGVGFENNDDFEGVDGLLGLGQGPISFPSQLGVAYGKVFSYCLVTWSDSPSQTSPIIFGSGAVPSGDVSYTPLQTDTSLPTYWFLGLNSISVNDQQIGVQKTHGVDATSLDQDIIIDSGTTMTMLDTSNYEALTKALAAEIIYPQVSGGDTGLDFCFNTSHDASPSFPGTTFHFEAADWVIPQENLFLPVDEVGTWCLFTLASDQGIQIFGNRQQQNFRVVYDQTNAQLGWIQTQCDAI